MLIGIAYTCFGPYIALVVIPLMVSWTYNYGANCGSIVKSLRAPCFNASYRNDVQYLKKFLNVWVKFKIKNTPSK